MTLLGIAFALLFGYFLVFRREQFLFCVAAAMTCPDSAFLVVGGIGISPYYISLLVVAVLAFSSMAWPKSGPAGSARNRWTFVGICAVVFLVYVTLLTLIAPAWFEGLPIVSPRNSGTNEVGAVFTPLGYTDSNVAQLAYLTLNLVLVFYIARAERRVSTIKVLMTGFGIGIALAVVLTLVQVGITYGVHGLFDNSPRNFYATEASEIRMRGQFSEPSHLAAFATASLAFSLSSARLTSGKFRVLSWALVIGSLASLVGAGAGTAAVAILPLAGIYVLGGILRIARRGRIAQWVVVGLPIAVGVGIMAAPKILQFGTDLVTTKLNSISYIIRAPQDENAWSLVWSTNGLGVGLGSSRSSSLALMMLSTVGVLGFLLLIVMLVLVICQAAQARSARPAAWAALAFCACAVVSLADFASPVLWLTVGLCFAEYKRAASARLADGMHFDSWELPWRSNPSGAMPTILKRDTPGNGLNESRTR